MNAPPEAAAESEGSRVGQAKDGLLYEAVNLVVHVPELEREEERRETSWKWPGWLVEQPAIDVNALTRD